jgi:hypothetical protein
MNFEVKAFSFATHVICGMLSLPMQVRTFLGTLEPTAALQTMKAFPIQPHFAMITVANSLVLVARRPTWRQGMMTIVADFLLPFQ